MFFWAASFEKRACWNTSLSRYVRVEMFTVSADDRRRDMSSKAAVVFPVPVSPFSRRSRVFRSSNFCNSGGKGISGDAFFFQAEDGIRDYKVTGVQTCALPI